MTSSPFPVVSFAPHVVAVVADRWSFAATSGRFATSQLNVQHHIFLLCSRPDAERGSSNERLRVQTLMPALHCSRATGARLNSAYVPHTAGYATLMTRLAPMEFSFFLESTQPFPARYRRYTWTSHCGKASVTMSIVTSPVCSTQMITQVIDGDIRSHVDRAIPLSFATSDDVTTAKRVEKSIMTNK